MPYIPHTPEDTQKMLAAIGVDDIQALFDEIPRHYNMQAFKKYQPALMKWKC